MSSTLKADVLSSKTTNGDLSISGDGSGVPDLEAGFKVGGVAGVPTASIQDDAVTLAKMASGTDGTVLTFDASGNPTAVGPGSDGEVLTSTGAGSPPAFEAASGGGAWTLIGTAVASDDATLTVTGLDSTYDTYAIAISDLSGTNDTRMWFRFGDSGGIDSGADNYSWGSLMKVHSTDSDAPSTKGDDSDSWMEFTNDRCIGYNVTGGGVGGLVTLNRPGDGNTFPNFSGTMWAKSDAATGANSQFTILTSGCRLSVIAVTQVQVGSRTANLDTGRMTVWGIAHA